MNQRSDARAAGVPGDERGTMGEAAIKTADLAAMKRIARGVRLDVLEMTSRFGGHPSSCFSTVEILVVLYFGGILRCRPAEPEWPERDRFILSKGHAAPALYSVLARAGYFSPSELARFRTMDSPLHGHPKQDTAIGVEVTSGSLGQGLSFGLGTVLAGRLANRDFRAFVLTGDGECDEGQVWEAAMAASHYAVDRLTAIVDYNKYQQTGPIEREMALEPFAEKWRAFGWHVVEADGHDLASLREGLLAVLEVRGRPQVLIAHTRKGKGVSFMEEDYTYHAKSPSGEQYAKAREEILCG
jgi:transketolase